MEAIRQIVDGKLLNKIVALPQYFQNKKVELIIMPVEEKIGKVTLDKSEFDNLLKGTITESLIGAVPNSGQTITEYRSERLGKYECTD